MNFFLSGKSVVLFNCVLPMDSLVAMNVGKILFIYQGLITNCSSWRIV